MSPDFWPSMTRLAATFPCLKGKPGVAPFDPEKLLYYVEHGSPGSGARAAAAFLLNVFNGQASAKILPFDLTQAFGAWDHEQRAAFVAWASAPVFP